MITNSADHDDSGRQHLRRAPSTTAPVLLPPAIDVELTEAAVVVRIFELYVSGLGLKAIAKRLTSEGAAHPKRFRRQDGLALVVGWSPATIRTILHRDLYRGVVVWNRSRKQDDWGQVDERERPTEQWVEVPMESLRIVSDALWNWVRSRCADTDGRTLRFESGRLSGRPHAAT